MPQTYAPIRAGAGGILLEAPDTLPSVGVLALAVDAAGKMSSVAFPATTRETLGLATTDSPTFAGVTLDDGSASGELNLTSSAGRTGYIRKNGGIVFQFTAFSNSVTCYTDFSLANKSFGFSGSARIHSDAANTLAQRNGTNGQKSRLYKTFTSATSGEWLEFDAATDASNFDIAASIGSAGGTARGIRIGGKNAAGTFTPWMSFATSGSVVISTNPTDTSIHSNSLSNTGFSLSHYNTLTCRLTGDLNGSMLLLWDNNGSGRAATVGRGNANDFNSNQSVIKYVAGAQYFYASSGYSQINTRVGIDGLTSSHVAFKRDGTILKIRLGDDSADADFTCSSITASGTINGRASTTSAATAPIKLPTGVLMTTPEAGAIEYDGTDFYGTNSLGRGAFARGGDSPTFAGATFSGQSLTGSQATSLLDLATTWNTTGTPSAFKLNVTDTASNAASLLMDLQVGGISQAAIRKDGRISVGPIVKRDGVSGETFGLELGNGINAGASAHAYIRLKTNWGDASISSWGGAFSFSGAGVTKVVSPAFSVNSSGSFGFSSGTAFSASDDVILHRDAAATLAQRNSTTGQKSRLYKTYTSATSGEWLELDAATDASNFDIAASIGSAGGTARGIRIGSKNAAGTFASWLSFLSDGRATLGPNSDTYTALRFTRNGTIVGGINTASSRLNLFGGSNDVLNHLTILPIGDIGCGVIPASRFHVFENTNNTGTTCGLMVEQGGTGDAVIQYLLSGVRRWVTGIDNSDNDKFKIASTENLGTDTHFTLSTTGDATFGGTINPRSGTTSAGTAPIKIATGVLMTTPEAGAIEYDGTNLYFTDSGGVRRQLAVV